MLIIKRDDQYGYCSFKIFRGIRVLQKNSISIITKISENGELTTYYQPSSEGPARKYYKVTDQGNDRLADLLHECDHFQVLKYL